VKEGEAETLSKEKILSDQKGIPQKKIPF